jgi:RNA polymerase sigma-70 factor (ECF subfamily)
MRKVGDVGSIDRRSDEDLLLASRAEREAFGEFYRRHEDRVLRFFLRRSPDPETAVDLAAETFAAALSSVGRFRPRREPAEAWLFGIARNVLAMSYRRGRVEAKARRRLGMAPLAITDEVLERVQALNSPAMGLVDGLPAAEQLAVRARVVEDRDYEGIARDLQCSEAVVRKRVSRGLSTLRREMEDAQ